MTTVQINVGSDLVAVLQSLNQPTGLGAGLFNTVTVPPAVVREVSRATNLAAWIVDQSLTQPLASQVLAASLGPGEREAICLALEQNATWLMMDDLPARRLATVRGV
jgi:predicted nucleic acid-binding protein